MVSTCPCTVDIVAMKSDRAMDGADFTKNRQHPLARSNACDELLTEHLVMHRVQQGSDCTAEIVGSRSRWSGEQHVDRKGGEPRGFYEPKLGMCVFEGIMDSNR